MATPIKLALCVPFYGTLTAQWMRSLIQLKDAPPCPIHLLDCIGDSLVPRARNTLAHLFLASDCTHLLFVDSDVPVHPDHIGRLISHDLEKYPLICGLYPKKKPTLEWVINGYEVGELQTNDDGLASVKYAGTGCMLIARSLLREIQANWPNRFYRADDDEKGSPDRYDFFPVGPRNIILPDCPASSPGSERYLSEDWAFCELVRALGHPVMVDPIVQLTHLGQISYPIDPQTVLTPDQKAGLARAQALVDTLNASVPRAIEVDGATTNHIPLQPILDILKPEAIGASGAAPP